jgi:hypothetical protein
MGKIKRYFAETFILVGTLMSVNNLLRFKYKTFKNHGGFCIPKIDGSGCGETVGAAYYYQEEQIIYITLGIALIVLGVLILRRQGTKVKNNQS